MKSFNNRYMTIVAAMLLSSFSLLAQSVNEKNLRNHLEYLCSDKLEGRKAGTQGEIAAAQYLFDQLSQAGLIMMTPRSGQDFSIVNGSDTIYSRNIVGIVEGYDKRLRDEYIVVGANYDHLGVNYLNVNGVEQKQIFRGADDNGSGIAVLIEVAKLVAQNSYMFPRSIVFVGFGAAEEGMAGSWYFVNRAFPFIENVKLMVNLDMLGRGDNNNPFQIFSAMSNKEIREIIDRIEDKEPVALSPEIISAQMPQADYLSFHNSNIPFILLTTGISREYHTVRDLPKFIMYDNLKNIASFTYLLLEDVSMMESFGVDGRKPSVNQQDSERVYAISECTKSPRFFNADEISFMDNWVYKYLKYPRYAVENGIQGTVVVSFIIEKSGEVSNVEIQESVHSTLDNEAIKVVSASPKWSPGEIRGERVRTRISVPIRFILRENK